MGVVTVSSSAAHTPLRFSTNFGNSRCAIRRPLIVAFKSDKSNNTALVAPEEQIPLPLATAKGKKRPGKADGTDVLLHAFGLDSNEAAAKLESIYKLSPTADPSDLEDANGVTKRGRQGKRKTKEVAEKTHISYANTIVRSGEKKPKRLSLDRRIYLKKKKEVGVVTSMRKIKDRNLENEKIVELVRDLENEKIVELVREYSASTDLVSLDWKKMKIPPVLSSAEHAWLFRLMQPMKALAQVKENLQQVSGREPTEGELAEATNGNIAQLQRHIEVGRAARNKLIKHNLRLVLFVINKYFQDFANGPKFHDLCQAGVKGLITAIDRFEPKRRFRLSTYGLFWIRHAIIRSMTLSSFTRVSFGLESVRFEIQKAKLELLFELQRQPTEEEIIENVGISRERYHEVMRASKPVSSLHSRHTITQEEFISGITDTDGGDKGKQPALLRLALDDVLDSLKPKESLVIRQRYGLDGKGDRTLGEIAGNLNISREMVRKHEMKALMKLKHPARVDYLRRFVV